MRNENNLDKLFKERLGDAKSSNHPEHLWDGIELRLDQMNGGNNGRRLLFLSLALLVASLMIGSAIVFNYDTQRYDKESNIIDIEDSQINENDIASTIEEKSTQFSNGPLVASLDMKVKLSDKVNEVKKIKSKGVNSTALIKETINENPLLKTSKNNENYFLNESGNLVKTFPILIEYKNKKEIYRNAYSYLKGIDYQKIYKISDFVSKDGCLDYVDKPYNKMYLDILGGSQMTDRLLYTENADWQDNVILRNSTEQVKNSYSLGLRFTYMFDRGVSIKTGLLYSVINEVLTETKYVVKKIYDEQTGEYLGEERVPKYTKIDNTYKFYDIPLLISYNWTRKNIFAEFNSGIIMNIYAKQTGEFYDQTEKRVKFNTTENSPFKSFVGGSLYTSAALGYNLPNSNASFFLEPHVRYHLTSISSKSYPIKQKYVNYGLYLGIRYQIK